MIHKNILIAIIAVLNTSLATAALAQTYIAQPGLPANDLNSLSGNVVIGTTNHGAPVLDVHATLSAPGTTLAHVYTYSDSQTTLSGGTIDNGLSMLDSSVVTLGGTIVNNGLSVRNFAMVNVRGGISNNSLVARENGVVNLSSGTIYNSLLSFDNGVVNMTGGTVSGNLIASEYSGASTVTMSGGAITNGLLAGGTSSVYVSGGTVAFKEYDSFGGSINLFGHNLTATFSGTGTGDFGDVGGFWDLGGTLNDGTSLSGYQYWEQGAKGSSYQHLILHSASTPEPGAVPFGLTICLSTAMLVALKRKR